MIMSSTGACIVSRLASCLASIWISLQAVLGVVYIGMFIYKPPPFNDCVGDIKIVDVSWKTNLLLNSSYDKHGFLGWLQGDGQERWRLHKDVHFNAALGESHVLRLNYTRFDILVDHRDVVVSLQFSFFLFALMFILEALIHCLLNWFESFGVRE